jgi:hypothetical protein
MNKIGNSLWNFSLKKRSYLSKASSAMIPGYSSGHVANYAKYGICCYIYCLLPSNSLHSFVMTNNTSQLCKLKLDLMRLEKEYNH